MLKKTMDAVSIAGLMPGRSPWEASRLIMARRAAQALPAAGGIPPREAH